MKPFTGLAVFLPLVAALCTADSPCGDWEPYKDEKCFKVITKVGSFDEAEKACRDLDSSAQLISIASNEEQQFIEKLLFVKAKVPDNVWIGAKNVAGKFVWSHEKESLTFTNWAPGCPKNVTASCVEMHSEGQLQGKWDDVQCMRHNAVVCQKRQSMSLPQLHELVLKLRDELGTANKLFNNKIMALNTNLDEAHKKISNLKQNPVPVGFIYVQLPSEKAPTDIWPGMTWTDVSSSYAGVFFRVTGGDAASFGTVQQDNAPRITQAKMSHSYSGSYCGVDDGADKCSFAKNAWSPWFWNGLDQTGTYRFMQLLTSGGEVRPRNMAMRVWKRTA